MIAREIEDLLIAKETALVAAQKERDFAVVEALLADDFREIGSSGRIYSKAEALDAIRECQIIDYLFEDFRIFPVQPMCVIVTYIATVRRVRQGQEHSGRAYRSSVWVQRGDRWVTVFHQASVLPPT